MNSLPRFKAWDKVNKVMYQLEDIESIIFETKVIGIYTANGYQQRRISDFEILHYTRRDDKKGNPIFEGDIVKAWDEGSYVPDRDSGGGITGYDYEEGYSQLGEIGFDGAWFTYETKKHLQGVEHKIFAPLDFNNNLDVVGNVYENSVLLEVPHERTN